jgi:hypothetical protein
VGVGVPLDPPAALEADHSGAMTACALCHGDGEVCNPDNADPARAIEDWLPPVICPRCGGRGVDPCPERRLTVVPTA